MHDIDCILDTCNLTKHRWKMEPNMKSTIKYQCCVSISYIMLSIKWHCTTTGDVI